jgi:hypothetical protein
MMDDDETQLQCTHNIGDMSMSSKFPFGKFTKFISS